MPHIIMFVAVIILKSNATQETYMKSITKSRIYESLNWVRIDSGNYNDDENTVIWIMHEAPPPHISDFINCLRNDLGPDH